MANRIRGITIEIGGDTTKLDKALSGTNKNIKDTQSALKDVERLLKLSLIHIFPEGTNLILVYASIRTTDFQYVTFCTPGRTTEIGYLQCSWDKDTNKITIKNGSAVIMDFCYTCLA